MLKNLFSNKTNRQIAFKNSFWLFAGEGIIRITSWLFLSMQHGYLVLQIGAPSRT
jgi:hypothetical protein